MTPSLVDHIAPKLIAGPAAAEFAELVRARGKIVSRQDLMVALWQTDEFLDDNTLTVNVNRLRRTLESLGAPKGSLKTHRGQGYSL